MNTATLEKYLGTKLGVGYTRLTTRVAPRNREMWDDIQRRRCELHLTRRDECRHIVQ